MRTNSYYSGRYTETSKDYQCGTLETDVARGALSLDSAYVVSPAIALRIAESPAGPNKCHDVDGFILCSANTNFGLGPAITGREERLKFALQNADFEDGGISPWLVYGRVDVKISTNNVHSGKFSLAEESGSGSVYQDVTGLEVGATYRRFSDLFLLPSKVTAPAQLAISDTAGAVPAFSPLLKGQQAWQFFSQSVRAIAPGTIRIPAISLPRHRNYLLG